MESLLTKIAAADKECCEVLQEFEITTDVDLQALCYEALKEIFPGNGKKLVQRSKVWNIIKSSLKQEKSTPSTSFSQAEASIIEPLNDSCLDASSPVLEKLQQTPLPQTSSTPKSRQLSVANPVYTIYSDVEALSGAGAGTMTAETRHRLVRGTIHIMVSAASQPPFNRLPSTVELEEMSKSLILTYPCLRDPEAGHGILFKQLKRRLSNLKKVKKPQGPCQNKKRKHITKEDDSSKSFKESLSASTTSTESSAMESDSENDALSGIDNRESEEMMAHHYRSLKKEMTKKKPNEDVINSYLNKEFVARRNWARTIPAEHRCRKIVEVYPCFKDHVEVIEEARRILNVEAAGRETFMEKCLVRLHNNLDHIIYFGMINKGLKAPKASQKDAKLFHALSNLATIFPSKKAPKKVTELYHQLKNSEDPDTFCSKQNGHVPVLLATSEQAFVIVGKQIICEVDTEKLDEAVVAHLAAFYLLDFDYPKNSEVGMSMLQYLLFNDESIPQDITTQFKNTVAAYKAGM
eukprot:Seg679.17 transcript_id=Seg679.17/GoldUCD/mRNA.D3Y31 product="hypothetical protein" protein_id=Seg679.17/GoldUCD/D3Y31